MAFRRDRGSRRSGPGRGRALARHPPSMRRRHLHAASGALHFCLFIFQSGTAFHHRRRCGTHLARGARRRRMGEATYSTIIDRAVGLLSLALFVLAGIPASFAMIQGTCGPHHAPIAWLGERTRPHSVRRTGGAAVDSTQAIFFDAPPQRRGACRLPYYDVPARGRLDAGVVADFQILTLSGAWLAAKSVAAPFNLVDAVLLFPPVLLITTIPISIAGWAYMKASWSWPSPILRPAAG